jgi:hypothetical protein
MDTVTDSERFYNTVLDLLEDVEEKEEVRKLLVWWNWCVTSRLVKTASELWSYVFRQIFLNHLLAEPATCKNSALARIKAKRLERSASTHDARF